MLIECLSWGQAEMWNSMSTSHWALRFYCAAEEVIHTWRILSSSSAKFHVYYPISLSYLLYGGSRNRKEREAEISEMLLEVLEMELKLEGWIFPFGGLVRLWLPPSAQHRECKYEECVPSLTPTADTANWWWLCCQLSPDSVWEFFSIHVATTKGSEMTQEIKPVSRFWERNALGGVVASINQQYT